MKTGLILIMFPVLFLVVTGFIYVNYVSWQTTCQGVIACQTGVTNNVNAGNPASLTPWEIFSLLGNGQGLFGGNSTGFPVPIPWVSIVGSAYTTSIGFYVPWFSFTSAASFGGFTLNACSFFGFACSFTFPSISIPWLSYAPVYLSIPPIGLPGLGYTTYTIVIPNLFYTIISSICFGIAGGLMVLLGLGIGISAATFEYQISDHGAQELTLLGTALIVWAFLSLFAGLWLSSLDFGWGNIITTFLGSIYIFGVYITINETGAS